MKIFAQNLVSATRPRGDAHVTKNGTAVKSHDLISQHLEETSVILSDYMRYLNQVW